MVKKSSKSTKKSLKKTLKKTLKSNECNCRLSIKGAALSLGIVWGVAMFLIGLASMTGYGVNFLNLFSKVYIGYAPTLSGSIIGGI